MLCGSRISSPIRRGDQLPGQKASRASVAGGYSPHAHLAVWSSQQSHPREHARGPEQPAPLPSRSCCASCGHSSALTQEGEARSSGFTFCVCSPISSFAGSLLSHVCLHICAGAAGLGALLHAWISTSSIPSTFRSVNSPGKKTELTGISPPPPITTTFLFKILNSVFYNAKIFL